MSWELKEHTHPVSSPGAWLVLWFASTLLGSVLGLVCLLVLPFGDLASIGLWIVLVLTEYQGHMFKLSVIGDLAEKLANNA